MGETQAMQRSLAVSMVLLTLGACGTPSAPAPSACGDVQALVAASDYTSSGVGTWGPPMRVGTRPEVVLITFV